MREQGYQVGDIEQSARYKAVSYREPYPTGLEQPGWAIEAEKKWTELTRRANARPERVARF